MNSIGPNTRTLEVDRATGATNLLFVDQHAELGGGQQISLSLVTHRFFKESFKVAVALPQEGTFSRELQAAGITVYLLPGTALQNGPKRVSDLIAFCANFRHQYKWFASKLKEDKYDALYTSSPRYLLPALLACMRRDKRLYFHVHCFYRKFYQELFLALLFSSPRITDIFCPSQACLNWVRTRLRRTRNVHYVPNWIPNDANEASSPPLNILPTRYVGSFKIGIVGRIVRIKGHDIFLKAIRKLLNERLNIEAYIVGSELYNEGDRFADTLRMQYSDDPRIHFVGERRPIDLVYRQLSCVVIPSRTEVFGLVAIEAMRMRTPVIVSDVDELPFIVGKGDCGLVFKAGDVDDLATALKTLMNDNELSRSLADEAYNRTIATYSRERSVALIVERLMTPGSSASRTDPRI